LPEVFFWVAFNPSRYRDSVLNYVMIAFFHIVSNSLYIYENIGLIIIRPIIIIIIIVVVVVV